LFLQLVREISNNLHTVQSTYHWLVETVPRFASPLLTQILLYHTGLDLTLSHWEDMFVFHNMAQYDEHRLSY